MSALNKENTCALTGHRILPKDFNEDSLEKVLISVIERGYNVFLDGMALGFDALCFKVLKRLKDRYDIKIVACVPCDSQSKFFNKRQKAEYDGMIAEADEVIMVSEKYFDGCMTVRNYFMVDNSSLLIAYKNYNGGGTYQTVKYAAEKGNEIIYIER